MSGTFTGSRSLTALASLISLALVLSTHIRQLSGLLLWFTTSVDHECKVHLKPFLIPLRWKIYSVCTVLQVMSIIIWTPVITQWVKAEPSGCHSAENWISKLLLRQLYNDNDGVIKLLQHIIPHVLKSSGSQPSGLLSIFSARDLKCKCIQCQLLQRSVNTKYVS